MFHMLGAVQDVGIAWGLTADSLDVVPVTPQWRACQSRTDCHGPATLCSSSSSFRLLCFTFLPLRSCVQNVDVLHSRRPGASSVDG